MRLWLNAVVLECCYVTLASLRLWASLRALGVPAGAPEAVVIASSSGLASAVGVVPGAVGIWEGIAAAIAPAVGIRPANGFLAALVLRVLTMPVLVLVWMWIAVRFRRARNSDRGAKFTDEKTT